MDLSNIRLSQSLMALHHSNAIPLCGQLICDVYLPFICQDWEHVLSPLQLVRRSRTDSSWLQTYAVNLHDFLNTAMHMVTWEASLRSQALIDDAMMCTITAEVAHALGRHGDIVTLWKLVMKCTHLLSAFTLSLASTQASARIQLEGIDVHQYLFQAYESSNSDGMLIIVYTPTRCF